MVKTHFVNDIELNNAQVLYQKVQSYATSSIVCKVNIRVLGYLNMCFLDYKTYRLSINLPNLLFNEEYFNKKFDCIKLLAIYIDWK